MTQALIEPLLKRVRVLESKVEKIGRKGGRRSPRSEVLTIASGVITVGTRAYYLLLPESGIADDLVTINGGSDGYQMIIQPAESGDTITVKETGNIILSFGDRVLVGTSTALILLYNATLGKWIEIGTNLGETGVIGDAETLDGLDSTDFALAGHTHDASAIVSGVLDDARIPVGITRDAEVMGIVLAGDGPGSGLDADFLDGLSSAAFAAAIHAHAGEDITSGTVADGRIASTITRDSEVMGIVLAGDGAGSGLDADLLDGLSSLSFFRLAGIAGGQTGKGGLNSGDDLTLDSTGDAAKGTVFIQPSGGNVNIGSVGEVSRLNVGGGLYLGSPELDFNAIRIRPTDGLGVSRIQAVGDNAISHTELVLKQLAPAGAGNPTDSSIEFRTTDGGTLSTRMWLLDNGFLGIGVSPSSALDIRLSHVNAVVQNIVNLNGDSSISIYAAGPTAFGITPWIDAAVIESGSTTGGGLVLSAYVGSMIFQTGSRATQMIISDGGYLYFADDTDRAANIGRTRIGAGHYSDYAWFSHRDLTGDGQYALLQGAAGDTLLNAPTGRVVYFRINNSGIGAYSSSQWEMSIPLALGVSAAQGRIHGHDGNGGFLFVSKTAIDGTAQVLIPNGTGDVTKRVFALYTGGSSGGATFSGSVGLAPGADNEIYNDGTNAHILKLRVNADGSVDVRRTAGANTYTVSVWLVWQ